MDYKIKMLSRIRDKALVPNYIVSSLVKQAQIDRLKSAIGEACGLKEEICVTYGEDDGSIVDFLAERLFFASQRIHRNVFKGIVEVNVDKNVDTDFVMDAAGYITELMADDVRFVFRMPDSLLKKCRIPLFGFDVISGKDDEVFDYIKEELPEYAPDILRILDIEGLADSQEIIRMLVKKVEYIRATGDGDESDILQMLRAHLDRRKPIGFSV